MGRGKGRALEVGGEGGGGDEGRGSWKWVSCLRCLTCFVGLGYIFMMLAHCYINMQQTDCIIM